MSLKHSIKNDYLQRYIREHIKETQIVHDSYAYYYECTVTYDPSYWSLGFALDVTPQVIADVLKPIIRQNPSPFTKLKIAYSVEYLGNGYPHIHMQILNDINICPEIQRSINQRLCRRYGRSQWYQTGNEDRIHVNSKYPEGILWSEYIKKDVLFNEQNGQRHYYEYNIGF